tara:strand:+ start:37219 stop:37575 length:357 start_codon:yes stop_codon:yes gene_type:complete
MTACAPLSRHDAPSRHSVRSKCPFFFVLLALAAAGCSDPERARKNANFAKIESEQSSLGSQTLPPIGETRSYRCRRNIILDVDYFQDGTGALLRTRDGIRTRLIATTIGGPFITRDRT